MKKPVKDNLEKIKAERRSFKKEFQEFINRGNVVDLAVGVVVGNAFTSIVNSLVNDVIMPVVGLIAGGVDFTSLAIDIPNFFGTGDHAHIAYGNFIQNVVYFFLVAYAVFIMVRTINRIREHSEANSVKLKEKMSELKEKNKEKLAELKEKSKDKSKKK